jgi:dTDP-4-amino-4,6-dideoxygalactose transaminase
MESIMSTAEKYGLTVIEDATEALGTKYTEGRYAGKFAGTIGHFGCYSFNGNKIITTGGGGAITANKPELVDHLRFLSTQAKTDPHYYIHDEIGYNYRMTNLQAALGVAQMEELPEFIERKARNYEQYCAEFAGFELGCMMPFRSGTRSNHWFYSLNIDRSKIKPEMRTIITVLEAKRIQTRAIWGLINEQKPYRDADTYKLEKAPYYADRILNLPSSTQITSEEINYVVKEVKALLTSLAQDK